MMWAGLYHLYLTSLPIRQFMQRELVPAWSGPADRLAPADQPTLSQVLAEIEGWLGR